MRGEAEVLPKPGKSFDPARIPKAIKDAGFSAPEVVATMVGTLVQGKDRLELSVGGLNHPFVLAGGPQEEALKKRTDLVGKVSADVVKCAVCLGSVKAGTSILECATCGTQFHLTCATRALQCPGCGLAFSGVVQ